MKSYGVTIQMKATEQYFPVVLFIMPYKVVLTFESVDKSYGVTIQMKATEQYFPVVLFIMLYRVVLTFESVDTILNCGHFSESYLAKHVIRVYVFAAIQKRFHSNGKRINPK